MMVTDKTGPLAAQLLVQPEEDILLITGDGTIIRARVADIRLSGRNTQGVRIMRIAEGSEVVAVARSEAEEDDLPEESDASVSDAPEEGEAPADAGLRPGPWTSPKPPKARRTSCKPAPATFPAPHGINSPGREAPP